MIRQLHASIALPLGKKPCYPLDIKLGASQTWAGVYRKEKIPWPCLESNPDSSLHWLILTFVIVYFFSLWLYSPLDLGRFFNFLILYTVGRTPWTGDQPVARLLPTHRTTQTQNKRTQTSIPWVGFEPTIPVFERVKAVHASDRPATVIGVLLTFSD
jgi:hypothetical protein